MNTSGQSCSRIALLLIVLTVLSSGTAYAFADSTINAAPANLPPFDSNERPRCYYLSLAHTLDDPLHTAEQEQSASNEQPDAASAKTPPLRVYIKEFFPDVLGGTKRIFSKDNLPVALVGVGLTGLALTVDQRVKKYFQDRKPLEHLENIGDKIGNGYPEIGVGFALLGTGELINDKKLADTGAVTLEAFVVNGIGTEVLKYAVRRKRPNSGNNMSFPSGHASNTAMLAASVSEMYDWDLRIVVPLYMTTAFVGASRIQANEHFLSDVIAGMTVGTLAGMSVAKYHKEKDAQRGLQDITLLPVLDKDLRGCVITLRFL
jgi:hypothetical protein